MDYKYLILRYQTFRREHPELSGRWLKNSWAWLWDFSVDNCKFLYRGEITQITLLQKTIRQQNDYIDFLSNHRNEKDTPYRKIKKRRHENRVWTGISLVVRILLLPVSFLIYWVRRIYRMFANRRIEFLVSDRPHVEDRVYTSSCHGMEKIYIFPEPPQTFPSGLVIFRYSLTVLDGTPDVILYIDPGLGYISEYSIPLPYRKGGGEHELLLEMPPACSSLLLRVTSGDGHFEFKNASMTEINLLQAATYLKKYHGLNSNDVLHALFIRKLPGVRRILAHKLTYAEWDHKYARLTDSDRRAIGRHIDTFANAPLLSVIVNATNHNSELLDQSLQSLHKQLYRNWEALVLCNETPDAHLVMVLNRHERYDNRIKILIDRNAASISSKPADAVRHCKGAYTALLEQGDLLTEHALYLAACWIAQHPEASLLYTDYDRMDAHGRRFDPCLKPDWNYELLLGKNYLRHMEFYRTDILADLLDNLDINPFTESYRLNLEFVERVSGKGIHHIPYLLLHHRVLNAAGNAQNDRDAVAAHLQRTGQPAEVTVETAGHHVRRLAPEPEPLISLIVLTRDRVALLSNCVNGILNHTAYKNIELVIVDNGSVEPATLDYLDAIARNPRVKVLPRPIDFNFSDLNNYAVEHTSGDLLGLINNDISIIEPGWLHEMVGHIVRPEVGAVGAKLYYENDTIQHAGVIIGLGGVAGHAFRHAPRYYHGYDDRLQLAQELSCVTAACLLTRKDVYKAVGGLDEINLRVAMNDVDYCLKVREYGLKVIWTPFAELYHLESASRSSDLSKENINRWMAEYNFMRNKWRPVLEQDPCYNPNLSIADEEFNLACPPRLIHPWERYRYAGNPD